MKVANIDQVQIFHSCSHKCRQPFVEAEIVDAPASRGLSSGLLHGQKGLPGTSPSPHNDTGIFGQPVENTVLLFGQPKELLVDKSDTRTQRWTSIKVPPQEHREAPTFVFFEAAH